jgi:hypothetical protein
MTKEEIEIQARFMALENLVLVLFASEYISSGWTIERIKAQHKQMIQQARQETFPKAGPALSDHFAAEYEQHITRLLRAVEQKVAARKG